MEAIPSSWEIEAKWTKKIGEKVTNSKYAKKVYLDSEGDDEKEKNVIKKIEDVLEKEEIKNYEEFNKMIKENKTFEFYTGIDFTIRKIKYKIIENKIHIVHCVVIFLFRGEDEFYLYLKEFTNEAKIGNIVMKFPEAKRKDLLREKTVEIVKEIVEGNVQKNVNEPELIEFFKDKKIVYSDEINLKEINKLIDAGKPNNHFIIPTITGALIIFSYEKSVDIQTISKSIEDINFYTGLNTPKTIIYTTQKNENYKEPKIKIVLVS